jgi:hypothetical protein
VKANQYASFGRIADYKSFDFGFIFWQKSIQQALLF